MLNILIDAYAIAPNWGSEQGMGWNWVSNLARFCNLHIITEGEWKKEIDAAINAALENNMGKDVNPTGLTKAQAVNMHFYYLPVSEEVREMCWNQGTWKFYFYYEEWERRALRKAKEIIEAQSHINGGKIDIVHKLNMICYREPSYLWKIKNIPFVWGPVGGFGYYPLAFLQHVGYKEKLKVVIKNLLIWATFRFQPRVRKAMKAASIVVSAYNENARETMRVYDKPYLQINETGAHINLESKPHLSDDHVFKIMWVGKFDHRKQLGIAIHTMALLKEYPNIHMDVLGSGYKEDVKQYSKMIDELNLKETVHLLGKVPNVETRERMQQADLLLFTSVDDATSTVVPEAIGAGLPVICHDMMGFGDLVDEEIGRKIKVINPEQSAIAFAHLIEELEADREEVRRLSRNCIKRQYEISWEANAKKMVEQYVLITSTYSK